MTKSKETIVLLLSLIFIFAMLTYTFQEKAIFWYLYAFTLLVGIAVALVFGKFEDQLPTWKYLIYGTGYGTITYGLVKLGFIILPLIAPLQRTFQSFYQHTDQRIFGIISCSSLSS